MKTSAELLQEISAFKIWRDRFYGSPSGKNAIRELRKLQRGDNALWTGNLEDTVLSTCFVASQSSKCPDWQDGFGRIGGLQYPVKLRNRFHQRKPRDVAVNSLIFHLTIYFRYFTADESTFGWGGKRMPKFGQPCYAVTGRFVNAVLPSKQWTEADIEKRTRRLGREGVRLSLWNLS